MQPGGTVDVVASNVTLCVAVPAYGPPARAVSGVAAPPIETIVAAADTAPSSSVTVSTSGYCPATAYACDVTTPLPSTGADRGRVDPGQARTSGQVTAGAQHQLVPA